jgi:hypothetical protein
MTHLVRRPMSESEIQNHMSKIALNCQRTHKKVFKYKMGKCVFCLNDENGIQKEADHILTRVNMSRNPSFMNFAALICESCTKYQREIYKKHKIPYYLAPIEEK